MNRVKIYYVVSIEGFVSGMDGSMDWIVESGVPREVEYGIQSFYDGIDTVVMTLSHYLDLTSCELLMPHIEKPCVIVRNRDDLGITSNHKVDYITDPAKGYPKTVEHIKKLKETGSGDIWVAGDNKLMKALFEAEVIDDVIITMIPVTLGKGIRMFPEDFNGKKWKCTKVFHNENGVTQVHFQSMERNRNKLIS